ncbi:TetR/AcrR family transcriptional regulator [Parvibaculum sp.]
MARDCDVSTATLYKHFSSKEALFTAVVKESAQGAGRL